MARLEIIIGAFLAGMGIWFSRQADHLPSSFLSYADPSFLILKLASSSFLFLGLALMTRALILSPADRNFILKQPLNLTAIALLILVFFLLLPKTGPFALLGLLFPLLVLLSVKAKWQKFTSLTLVLTLIAWGVYGIMFKIPFPK